MHAPLTMTYRVAWHSFTELEGIAGEWRDLAARAIEPNVFYEPSFVLPALKVFDSDAGAICVRSAGGRLVGLFPMNRGPFLIFSGFVHPYAPLGVPLVDRDDSVGIVGAWLDHLAKRHRTIAMPCLSQGPFSEALTLACAMRNLPGHNFDSHDRALLAPGTHRAGYLGQSSASRRRKNLLRHRRRLAELGDLRHSSAHDTASVQSLVDAFLKIEASGWKGEAGTAAGRDPAMSKFFRSAVLALAAEGKAQGDLLTLDGEPIAVIVVLRSGETAWAWKIAYDERFASHSPGIQVAFDATQTLLADTSIARTDSCTAPGPHVIDHLWHERLSLTDRMIGVRPGSTLSFEPTFLLEALRRKSRSLAKSVLRTLSRQA